MAEIESRLKKWGNSFGIIIPNDIVKKENLREGEKVDIIVIKKSQALKKTFGLMEGKWKDSAQKIKDDVRKDLYD